MDEQLRDINALLTQRFGKAYPHGGFDIRVIAFLYCIIEQDNQIVEDDYKAQVQDLHNLG